MSTIVSILKYDFRRFLRDRLMLAFAIAVLIMYVAVAAFVPDDISPTWEIALVEADAPMVEKFLASAESDVSKVSLKRFPSETELRQAFVDGSDAFVGIAYDAKPREALMRGEHPAVRIYIDESAPPEAQKTARAVGEMIATAAVFSTGEKQKREVVTVGPVVEVTSFHHRSRSLMAIFLLMMEMLALGSLISREISSGVVHAILTTTVSLPRYFLAKMSFGVVLAFVQVIVVAALSGALNPNPVVITAQLFLGAIMFTAAGLLAGCRGRHLMEVIMWSMLFLLPAIVPALAAMLPGTAPLVVQVLPTFPLVNGVLSAGFTTPLVSPWIYLGWTAAWAAVLSAAAFAVLRWRVK